MRNIESEFAQSVPVRLKISCKGGLPSVKVVATS